MDLSKAFDTIDHALLLTKLVQYNFDAHSVFWLSSYLQNRTQRMKIESELSSPCHIYCGVPQGSALGPILFIIYLNDLPFILQDVSAPSVFATKIHCYADDTRLYNSAKVSHLPLDKVVEDASIVMDWFTQSKLKVNPEKFKFMLTGSPMLLCEIPEELKSINIRGQELKCVTKAKHLGLTFDERMSWEPHINELKRRRSDRLIALSAVRDSMSQKTFTELVQATAMSAS